MRLLLVLMIVFAATAPGARAQELSETLSEVGEGYARGYLAPLMDAVGANFNAGLVPAAQIGTVGGEFNVYVGLKVFGAFVPESGTTFTTTYTGNVPLTRRLGNQSITLDVPAVFTVEEAPTFFGDSDPGAMVVHAEQDTSFYYLGLNLPVSFDTTYTLEGIGGLWSTTVAPFVVPEVVLGTYLGTDLMLRWVPEFSVESAGAFHLMGIGVRHRLNPYLPRLPFDLALQAVWQRAGADDDEGEPMVRISTFAANLQIGKRVGSLGLYAALQSEQSSGEVRYRYVPEADPLDEPLEPVPVRFTMAGANKMRGVVGVDLKLGVVHLNANAGIGRVRTVSIGLGVGYR